MSKSPCKHMCPPEPCYSKPLLRQLHMSKVKTKLTTAIALCGVTAILGFMFVKNARIAKYEEFHAKEDVEHLASQLEKKGLLQSVPLHTPTEEEE